VIDPRQIVLSIGAVQFGLHRDIEKALRVAVKLRCDRAAPGDGVRPTVVGEGQLVRIDRGRLICRERSP
jgi:hypothetical protein